MRKKHQVTVGIILNESYKVHFKFPLERLKTAAWLDLFAKQNSYLELSNSLWQLTERPEIENNSVWNLAGQNLVPELYSIFKNLNYNQLNLNQLNEFISLIRWNSFRAIWEHLAWEPNWRPTGELQEIARSSLDFYWIHWFKITDFPSYSKLKR